MLRPGLLLAALSFGTLGLGGCHLYFESDDGFETEPDVAYPDECTDRECMPLPPDEERPDREPPPEEEVPPQTCDTNEDCQGGCYCSAEGLCEESGFCRLNQDCAEDFVCNDAGTCVPTPDVEPPATCEDLSASEDACIASETCSPVYRGVNCTSANGEACTSDTADCTCESFDFDSCEDA